MHQLKLVIFDCDGVLFDSREANRVYYNTLLDHFGHPPMTEEEVDYVHIHNVMDSVAHIFRRYATDPAAIDRLRNQLDYRQFIPHMIMEPDLPAFLDFLQPDIGTAISTNRTTTMTEVLARNGLDNAFEMVVTALDVTHPKPHPEALEKILRHFQLPAAQAIYIGDSSIDQQHAAAAGMRFIAFRNPALNADFHVNSFNEVMALPIFDTSR